MTPINISIKHLQIPKGRRILAVSDIHGHCSLFQRLLKQADFSDSDILILIGDLIEKGRENLASLRYAMDLSQQSNVTVLMGNVDLMRLKMIEELCEETCEKFFDYLMTIRGRSWSSIFDEMASEAGITLDSPRNSSPPGTFSWTGFIGSGILSALFQPSPRLKTTFSSMEVSPQRIWKR